MILGGVSLPPTSSRERRQRRQHIAALRRAYGDGAILRQWIAAAQAGRLRTRRGQLDRWRRSLAELEADRRRNMGTVYLIHFSRPIGDLDNPRGQARHYIGWARDLDKRLQAHASGNGAAIMRAVTEAGIEWRCVRTWAGTRHDERALKRQHQASRFCPVCQGQAADGAGVGVVGGQRAAIIAPQVAVI